VKKLKDKQIRQKDPMNLNGGALDTAFWGKHFDVI
jgi:hypothetical protein